MLRHLLSLMLLLSPMSQAHAQGIDLNNSKDKVRVLIESFRTQLMREIQNPNSVDPDSPIFNTCTDWHSAVHCHWAFFRLDRLTSDFQDEAEFALKRLNRKDLKKEAKHLKNRGDSFEMPYGRSWFLKLVLEVDKWSQYRQVSFDQELFELGDLIAGSLLKRIEDDPSGLDLQSDRYNNLAWAFANLIDYYSHLNQQHKVQRVEQALKNQLAQIDLAKVQFDLDFKRKAGPEFFSPTAIMIYMLSRFDDNLTAQYISDLEISEDSLKLPPIFSQNAAAIPYHSNGNIWSRVLGFILVAKNSNPTRDELQLLQKATVAHVEKAIERDNLLNKDSRYAHWVPQFAILALSHELDEY